MVAGLHRACTSLTAVGLCGNGEIWVVQDLVLDKIFEICFLQTAKEEEALSQQNRQRNIDLKKQHFPNSFQKFRDPPKPGGLPLPVFLI
ncbi:hypothetical protein GRJ2_001595400 [Grus japonensis]|uniref:Uncharacterized protein n=1 Tax=Grus japonensis TaxID=30415 RepID=A0ABC9X1I3_GRUJA